eukprot:1933676-Rhodomonas_salina.2
MQAASPPHTLSHSAPIHDLELTSSTNMEQVVAVDADEASNKAALERGAQGEVYGLAAEGEAIRQLRVPLQVRWRVGLPTEPRVQDAPRESMLTSIADDRRCLQLVRAQLWLSVSPGDLVK